ncbi:Protein of unknown function, partial [Gryllus bimaculatus]
MDVSSLIEVVIKTEDGMKKDLYSEDSDDEDDNNEE